jgi:hypothetical protein
MDRTAHMDHDRNPPPHDRLHPDRLPLPQGAALRSILIEAGALKPADPNWIPKARAYGERAGNLGFVLRTDARGREVASLRRARGLWDAQPNFDQWA